MFNFNNLRSKIILLAGRSFFNPPAGEETIRDVEERLKITFPASVREFYRAFNGGFFADTILKSPVATETTLAIIETFAKVRELSRTIAELHQHDENTQKSMLQKSGEIISDIICSDLEATETETTIELNLAVLSVKHTVKRTTKKD